MELAHLWQAWPIAGPWHLTPLSGGTNNQVWRAETVDGKYYVLRVFPDLTQLPRLRYEAALLLALSNVDLPFRLPVPIMTHNAGSVAFLEQETRAFAILSPFLSGERPNRNDLLLAPPAGAAMAVLDNALAALPEVAAYMAYFPLSEEELRAIPAVLRLRDTGSLVHRMGRYFAGRETDATIQQRVEHSLWRAAWLIAHSETLLYHAMGWS